MNTEDPKGYTPAESLLIACPGCGGDWDDATGSLPGDAICIRCGLAHQEVLLLLWGEVSAAYAEAYEAARSGRFAKARFSLHPFLNSPLAEGALQRLDDLCAAVLGETEGDIVADAYRDYEAAHRAAIKGDFDAALGLIEHCLVDAPYLIPAQKLRMLALAGAGRGIEAESLRTRVAGLLPAEPDVTVWKFAAPSIAAEPITVVSAVVRVTDPVPVSRRRRSRRAARQDTRVRAGAPFQQKQVGRFALPVAIGALALAAISLTMSLKRPAFSPEPVAASTSSPSPSLSPLPAASGVVQGTSSPEISSENKNTFLAADLTHEWEERRQRASFAQARLWFNRAVRARDRGDWRTCDRFAAAAAVLGKNSYLYDESLVLRALAADNSGRSAAIRIARYRSIAEKTPNSAYAPWALRQAARLRTAVQSGGTLVWRQATDAAAVRGASDE